MTKEEVFQAVCWVTNKSYAEKQFALSHKAKIRIMPQRVKVRTLHRPASLHIIVLEDGKTVWPWYIWYGMAADRASS